MHELVIPEKYRFHRRVLQKDLPRGQVHLQVCSHALEFRPEGWESDFSAGDDDCEALVVRKPVLYLAHPVSGDMRGNARRAIDWIRWFHEKHPEVIVVAPWVAEVLAYADSRPDAAGPCATCPGNFERVIPDDEEIVRHLDGVVMVGGRVSPGMARERDAALAAGLCVIDMTHYVRPEDVEPDHELEVL